MKELNDLVELAQMATAGGWTTDIRGSVVAVDDQANSGFIICSAGGCDKSHNAAFIAAANPAAILAIAEAFRALEQESQKNLDGALAWQQRAEAVEEKLATAVRAVDNLDAERNALRAKLAELEKQEPAGWQYRFNDGDVTLDWKTVDSESECNASNLYERRKIFTRPAPAVSLAKLVPDDYFAGLVNKARTSADKAMLKFPQPNYVLLKVAEEAGEVVQAGVHYAENRMRWQELEGEIVQLLAMLIRLVTEGDQVNGITPPEECRTAILRNIEEQSQ